MSKSGKSTNLTTTLFLLSLLFPKSSCQYGSQVYYKKKIENKSLWKDEISYDDGTWYMDGTLEKLKKHAFIWLMSICMINEGPNLKIS